MSALCCQGRWRLAASLQIPDASVIKKAALILFTFSALVGAYLLYTAGFAMLAANLAGPDVGLVTTFESELENAQISRQLALEHFGPDHFSTKRVKLSWNDKASGSYLYADQHEFSEKGLVLTVKPFAMVSAAKDGKNHKTVTSDSAKLRFNQPFSMLPRSVKNTEPQRVVFAELIGHVMIRDNKGTPENPRDDLLIGPMTGVQYDEKSAQISSKSHVVIQDQDMIIAGKEMMLQLHRKANGAKPTTTGSGSFEVETAFLYHNIDIRISNVTSGGILPGQSKPDSQGQTPLVLQSTGQMRIDMPRNPSPVLVGPPNIYREPDPTYCRFEQNVRVVRGVTNPDQLNCDKLYLTLRPDKKTVVDSVPTETNSKSSPDAPGTIAANSKPVATGGPMTQLKLRTALAQGPAVWLQSESQGVKARCVELKYEKRLDQGLPDSTYLNGGTNKKLLVEKLDYETEGPKAGSVKSVMNLVSADMSILDYGKGGVNQITARGPGKSEERPSRGESVTRVAWFEDQMMLQTSRAEIKPPAASDPSMPTALPPLRRLVTLTGLSKLMDHLSGSTLEAQDKIVAEFESTPKAAGVAGDGPSRIKWLKAYNDVHLTTPGRTLTAKRDLQAIFVLPEPSDGPLPTPTGSLAVAPTPATPEPIVAQVDGEPALIEAKPDAPPKPVEAAVDGRANHVYATIVQGVGKTKGSDLRDAKLRGDVMVHQDPAPGERMGKNLVGQALDLYSQGNGMMRFDVGASDPQAANPEAITKLVAGGDPSNPVAHSRLGGGSELERPLLMARIEFDGKVIESENRIGLDQQANRAWAIGKGKFSQMADSGLLDDKGLASDRPNAAGLQGLGGRERLEIAWTDEMRFLGRTLDRQNREVAKIEFRGSTGYFLESDGRRVFRRGVQANKADAGIYCDTMDVYMDKTIDLSKADRMSSVAKLGGATPAPNAVRPATEPDAEIAFIECWGDNALEDGDHPHYGVDVTSQKFFEGTKILEDKYRIQHTHLIYDKRSGDFEGLGAGLVFLYNGKLPAKKGPKATQVKGTQEADSELHTLKLTKVQFAELVKGRFGVTRSGADRETRTAEFVGNVQVANAVVLDSRYGLDFDQLDKKPDAVFMTSDVLRVRSESRLVDNKFVDHQYLFAEGNAVARTVNRIAVGDRITYDSASELFYIYGDNGKRVSVSQLTNPGQPASRTNGTTLRYNKRTGESNVQDPSNIQILDPKTGVRPTPGYPNLGGSGPKPEIKPPPRMKFQRPGKTSTERNGFSGH